MIKSADFVAKKLKEAGIQKVKVIKTKGNPLVYAEWLGAPGKPTVLIYGHYDVQPVDPLELWDTPPFDPTVKNGKIYARGATDDKGQIFMHIKSVEAFLKTAGKLPLNIKFVIEGEEEIGSRNLQNFVNKNSKLLKCDAILISDTALFGPGIPTITYGLRGIAYMESEVTGPNRDLHSGTFGGAVANPANALAYIISQLLDHRTGKVGIPGFYDQVLPLEDWERKAFAALPHDEDAYRAELGIATTFGEEGYSTLERSWARPTCDVNGIFGGYQGEGAKTVLPAWAGAKVSMRLVPNQDPDNIARLFADYVESIAPPGVRVSVSWNHGAGPVLIDATGPFVEAAMAAQEDVWGNKPVLIREGGSIPIVGTFSEVLAVPVLLMGFGLSDDRLHSPNEKFNISHFYNGIRTTVRLLDRAADI